MKPSRKKRTAAVRRQAYQIALQLPEDAVDASTILMVAKEIHLWIIGVGKLPKERSAS